MSPHRISPGGSYKIDRRFRGVGRIQMASGTNNIRTFRKLDGMLSALYDEGHLDILEAIKDGTLSLREVYQASRSGRTSYLVADLLLVKRLWDAVEAWVPDSAPAASSRKRYETSWNALRKYGPLTDDATVRDLADVDWKALHRKWPNSAADFNRMRAAVSRFLSMYLEDKMHPFRREVVKAIPRAKEPRGRVPDITPDLFWKIIKKLPEPARPAFVTLAVTGLRIRSEYLALREEHLLPHTKAITVPGTKTEGSADVVRVGPTAWEWVKRAVPPPLQYKALYTHFKRAAKAVGVPDLTPHDLRHLHGQMLADAGQPPSKIQASLRHADPSMTRRYTMSRDRGEVARAVEKVMFSESSEAEEERS